MALSDNQSLRPGRARHSLRGGEAEDPMSSMGNLMDVMLVFACGLMIALVAHYNVQLSSDGVSADEQGSAPANVERLDADLQEAASAIDAGDDQYAAVGTVYRDTETGELYVVEN